MVDFVVVGNTLVSVAVSPGVPVVLRSEEVELDARDTGDLADPFHPFASMESFESFL